MASKHASMGMQVLRACSVLRLLSLCLVIGFGQNTKKAALYLRRCTLHYHVETVVAVETYGPGSHSVERRVRSSLQPQ